MYQVDCEQALAVGFLTVEGSPHEEEYIAEQATSKAKNKFRAAMPDEGDLELTYRF